MTTKLDEIFAIFSEELEDLLKVHSKDSTSYEFESSFNILMHEF